MAICTEITSEGFVVANGLTASDCVNYVLIDAHQYQIAVEPLVTPGEIASAFSWGFGSVVVLGWFSGYAIGIAKRVIRLI